MISALEKELQEKAQQLGEKLVEVETLQGRVSQQHVEIERLKSKDPRLARSVCLAEFEAHKLLETCPFLRSFSSQTTESSTPHHAHTPAPHLTLAQRLEMLHTRGAPSSHSSSGIITSPQPTTQNFIQSGPVGTSKAVLAAAASVRDSHISRFKSSPAGMLGAGTPPSTTSIPSMAPCWNSSDGMSAWETRSAVQVPKTSSTLAHQSQRLQRHAVWGQIGHSRDEGPTSAAEACSILKQPSSRDDF